MFYLYFEANPSNFENHIFFMISFICAICFIFFAPYVKKIFNKKEEIKKTQENYYAYFSAILYSLSTAILICFIFAYFVILYVYSAKVLIDFSNWPRGEISWLVIIFSTF